MIKYNKNKFSGITAAVLACSVMLSGCAKEADSQPDSREASRTAAEESVPVQEIQDGKGSFRADLSLGSPDFFEASDGWSNGSMFNVTWRASNCTFENGKMQLIIDKDSGIGNIPYSGGEYRSKNFYGYVKYEVSMKAIKNDGVVSSFFTYTGPSDGNPWDEIDVEILGKDPTKVQFNYFTNGTGNHEYMYDLGFDASEDFHTYGFEWFEDRIVWYVDGEEVYSAEENIPSVEGKIMMNAWCGTGVDGWLNPFDDSNMPLAAEYEWISFTEAKS